MLLVHFLFSLLFQSIFDNQFEERRIKRIKEESFLPESEARGGDRGRTQTEIDDGVLPAPNSNHLYGIRVPLRIEMADWIRCRCRSETKRRPPAAEAGEAAGGAEPRRIAARRASWGVVDRERATWSEGPHGEKERGREGESGKMMRSKNIHIPSVRVAGWGVWAVWRFLRSNYHADQVQVDPTESHGGQCATLRSYFTRLRLIYRAYAPRFSLVHAMISHSWGWKLESLILTYFYLKNKAST